MSCGKKKSRGYLTSGKSSPQSFEQKVFISIPALVINCVLSWPKKSLSSFIPCTFLELRWLVNYARYGHIKKLADAEAEGVREAGLEVDMYQLLPFQ